MVMGQDYFSQIFWVTMQFLCNSSFVLINFLQLSHLSQHQIECILIISVFMVQIVLLMYICMFICLAVCAYKKSKCKSSRHLMYLTEVVSVI